MDSQHATLSEIKNRRYLGTLIFSRGNSKDATNSIVYTD